eukprot:TRINITY_DN1794_c0_g1_i1.p1 TRINITY_DN1794_c0_g1~~TRINITY_DN1794_c0_g1_i1.p1  ORF type:complete len:534 (+),score=140.43 TRINITY_DN1794_c0_g1_i1:62-1663(+)
MNVHPDCNEFALELLTRETLSFLEALHDNFEDRRVELLQERRNRQTAFDGGEEKLDFLKDTEWIRSTNWKVSAAIPDDLLDRRVEITGPPCDRKMVINALNSGAKVFMADFEDSCCPTFENIMQGQLNLKEALRRTIEFVSPEGKQYALNDDSRDLATLMVRPRGWHMEERHVTSADGVAPMSASLFDFGVFFYHNAEYLLSIGSGPYFYLPKMESYLEARLWNDVFVFAQDYIGIPQGSVRATVLIETIDAVFQMDEILYELREHSAGLNCGRWDYIFSFIKKFKHKAEMVLPERNSITMSTPFMDAYVRLLVQTCHKRGVYAMGGMAAQIPIKSDPQKNEQAMKQVYEDKLREVLRGHDGTWVAHPGLISTAYAAFSEHMKGFNQLGSMSVDEIGAVDLLKIEPGEITEHGLRTNIEVALRYIEAWLRGIGCVAIHDKMEDAATAEISRAQVWSWLQHQCSLADGRLIDQSLVDSVLNSTATDLTEESNMKDEWIRAKNLLAQMLFAEDLADFLTTFAYEEILSDSIKLKR